MIHTKDLMLGNWVVCRVGGKDSDKRSIPMKVVALFDDCAYLDFDGNEGDVWEEYDKDLFGIEITEELLKTIYEKCEKVTEWSCIEDGKDLLYLNIFVTKEIRTTIMLYKKYPNKCDVSVLEYNGKDVGGDKIICEANDVSYLHELQNAYHLLTGKHLEVKL